MQFYSLQEHPNIPVDWNDLFVINRAKKRFSSNILSKVSSSLNIAQRRAHAKKFSRLSWGVSISKDSVMLQGWCKMKGIDQTVLYKFNSKDKTWKLLRTGIGFPKESTACKIGEFILIAFPGVLNTLLKYGDQLHLPFRIVCKTRLPYETKGHSITQISTNKVILISGRVLIDDILSNSSKAYEGTMNEMKNNVNWRELASMPKSLLSHCAFKIDNFLYIMGRENQGSLTPASFNFCLSDEKWSEGPSITSSMFAQRVLVDPTESFAFIMGWSFYSETAIAVIFTAEDGYKDLGITQELPCSRSNDSLIFILNQ